MLSKRVPVGTCPAGKSGYCNHIMVLMFEIANYSLHQLKTVPEETSFTSKKRQWGVPTDKQIKSILCL